MNKQKVAVLGGGGGAIAAAMELSATQTLRDQYEVTIYTPGWRLGGKAASGRNAAMDQRIEEHGLHVLFGFYENTFDFLETAYGEAGRSPNNPMATFEQALTPCDEIVVYDLWKGNASGFSFTAPTNDLRPGDGQEFDFESVVDFVGRQLVVLGRELLEHGLGLGHPHGKPGDPASLLDRILGWLAGLAGRAASGIEDEFHQIITDLEHRIEHDAGEWLKSGLEPIIDKLRTAADVVYKLWVNGHLDNDRVRFIWTTLDLASTILAGIVADDLLGNGFQSVNGEELRAWLHRHHAKQVTIDNSPLLRGLYDLTFAYEDGDTAKPNLAAGSAIEAMIRIVTQYKGHILYKMNAGMGDTVFAPAFETLTKRGVKFEFFHWVDKLGVADDRDVIETIRLFPQTTPADHYSFLVDVGGVPSWPSEPDWSKISGGDQLRSEGIDLEHVANPLNNAAVTLQRGTDFDHVVLGISVGSLSPMCDELSARDHRFEAMLAYSATVATQAVQVWSNRTVAELGWPYSEQSIAGAYREPVDTYCNMSHLIDREARPSGQVKSIGYFCGPLHEANTSQTAAEHAATKGEVRDRGIAFFNTETSTLWPNANGANGFDWNTLVDPDDGSGQARFDAQYWRANTQGSERYVRTPAGDIRYRLWPDETKFTNLALAGDWTRNGIDGGGFEAAVASGRLASQAICGWPRHVPGTTGIFEDSRKFAAPPPYVDFGGLDTFPGPYMCNDTELWSFMVKADESKLQALIDKVFNEPTMGAFQFAALGPYVMLSLGDIHHVVPETPPFSTMGSVDETQVAIWVPTVQVEERDGKLHATRFFMFTSYIWVNNAMSMATGREVFGWPKSMGEITLPHGENHDFSLACYGLNFGPDQMPSYMPLLELSPTGKQASSLGTAGTTLVDMAKALYETYETATDNHLQFTWDVGLGLLDNVVTSAVPEIFLKQFRDIETGTSAAYQAICTSRAVTETLEFEGLTEQYELKLHHIDSHPVGTDLGIEDQTLDVGFKVKMDFLQDVGEILWEADQFGN